MPFSRFDPNPLSFRTKAAKLDIDRELFGDFEGVSSTAASSEVGASSADTLAAVKTAGNTLSIYLVTRTSSRSRIEVGVWGGNSPTSVMPALAFQSF